MASETERGINASTTHDKIEHLRELREALDGWCELVDASDLVRLMRMVKSPQELDYHRRAGEVLDRACARAIGPRSPTPSSSRDTRSFQPSSLPRNAKG